MIRSVSSKGKGCELKMGSEDAGGLGECTDMKEEGESYAIDKMG
jgi:hypothetical protein